jgi:hypothetical protein
MELKEWCPRQESNPQPTDPKSGALSVELRGRVQNYTAIYAVLYRIIQKFLEFAIIFCAAMVVEFCYDIYLSNYGLSDIVIGRRREACILFYLENPVRAKVDEVLDWLEKETQHVPVSGFVLALKDGNDVYADYYNQREGAAIRVYRKGYYVPSGKLEPKEWFDGDGYEVIRFEVRRITDEISVVKGYYDYGPDYERTFCTIWARLGGTFLMDWAKSANKNLIELLAEQAAHGILPATNVEYDLINGDFSQKPIAYYCGWKISDLAKLYSSPESTSSKTNVIESNYHVKKLEPSVNDQSFKNNFENAVFISYAWGGDSEHMVDELEQALTKRGIKVVRDKKDLDYKGSIKAFEQRIGRGQCVVLVISDKYLRSEHCMYELVEVNENKNIRDRIFPIVLPDAQIYKPIDRLSYFKYWDKQIKQLNQAIKQVDMMTNMDGIFVNLNKIERIRASFDHLTDLLSDMNALTPEIHKVSGFSKLICAVERIQTEKKAS